MDTHLEFWDGLRACGPRQKREELVPIAHKIQTTPSSNPRPCPGFLQGILQQGLRKALSLITFLLWETGERAGWGAGVWKYEALIQRKAGLVGPRGSARQPNAKLLGFHIARLASHSGLARTVGDEHGLTKRTLADSMEPKTGAKIRRHLNFP